LRLTRTDMPGTALALGVSVRVGIEADGASPA
jgi:uncharacterized protein (DUF849 family)